MKRSGSMLVREVQREPWIATVDGVMSPEECRERIAWTEGQGYDEAPVTTVRGPVMNPGFRNNTRVMEDDPELAAWLWERLAGLVPAELEGWRAIGLNERFRYYRYEPGQYFRWHMDGAFKRSPFERSLITLMVYLNEGFEGGTTDFDQLGSIQPEEGMALLFEHHVLHQGGTVRSGVKYVLRTDVMYRALGM